MGNFKINKLDWIIFALTLESINISTPFGTLSIAFISILISTLFIFPKIKRYKISNLYPLIFFALWLTLISFFQGNSLLGNLSRCYSLVYLGIIIPDLKINKIKVVSAFRRVLNLHSFILILDYLFYVPWSWNNEDLFRIGINENFNRATGLFLEPSYFGLTVNLILLILVISKQVKKRDFLIVIISSFLTASLSAILGAILITSLYYFKFIIKNLINIF